jgi:hypothetical protein
MKATKYNRIAFQLVPRMRRTEGTGGGLLATPNTMDTLPPKTPKAVERESTVTRPVRTNFSNLRDQLYHGMLLPTPTISGNHNRAGLSEKSGDGLATRLAQMLPTLTVALKEDCPAERNRNTPSVAAQIGMLPTPDAAMHKTGYMGSNREGKQVNTETALREATGGANTGLKLQPAFAAWMMGYPEDWTLTPFLLENQSPPSSLPEDNGTMPTAGEKKASKPTETP